MVLRMVNDHPGSVTERSLPQITGGKIVYRLHFARHTLMNSKAKAADEVRRK